MTIDAFGILVRNSCFYPTTSLIFGGILEVFPDFNNFFLWKTDTHILPSTYGNTILMIFRMLVAVKQVNQKLPHFRRVFTTFLIQSNI